MDKICASPEAALEDLRDGASIAVSGFGTSYGFACSLLMAARDRGVKNLTLVSNGLGTVGQLRGILLVASGQVRKLIVSFSSRPGMRRSASTRCPGWSKRTSKNSATDAQKASRSVTDQRHSSS